MSGLEEETYSVIFNSLKHPIRRKILRILYERPRSFTEIQELLGLESPHVTYHLESLGNILRKTDDEKYALSTLGEAAVSMMRNVEEPPKTMLHLPSPSIKWKALSATFLIGIILLSSLCYFQYQNLTKLSGQYLSLEQERELFQEALIEALDLVNATLTYEYTKNGTIYTWVGRDFATFINEIVNRTVINGTIKINVNSTIITINGTIIKVNDSIVNVNDDIINVDGITIKVDDIYSGIWTYYKSNYYLIYSLTDNATLEIDFSVPQVNQQGIDLSLTKLEPVDEKTLAVKISVGFETPDISVSRQEIIDYKKFWNAEIDNNESNTYSVSLPSKGVYLLSIRHTIPPYTKVSYTTGNCTTDYIATFRIKGQTGYVPFFIKEEFILKL